MLLKVSLGVVLVVSALQSVCPANEAVSGKTKAPIIYSWSDSASWAARKQAPPKRYVADATSWKAIWKAWKGSEECPDIDFETCIVLVAANDDPNRISFDPTIDSKGNLKIGIRSTAAGYEPPHSTFGFAFAVVNRTRIKTIDGISIPKPEKRPPSK